MKYDFFEKLLSSGLANREHIKSLEEFEILEVEKNFSIKLPEAYISFIKDCGKGAGSLFEDCDFFYPSLLDLKSEMEEMVEEAGGSFSLPDNAFVFSAYQGFQYMFFICDGTEDPNVFRIMDDGKKPKSLDKKFSDYVYDSIDQYSA